MATTETVTELPLQGYQTDNDLQAMVLNVLYSIMMVIILFGNVILLLSIILHRSAWTATGILICSLAMADLLVGILVIPATIYGQSSDTHDGVLQCTLLPYCQLLCVSASIGSMLAICCERFRAIVKHKTTWTPLFAMFIVLSIWVAAALYSTRHFIQAAIKEAHMVEDEIKEKCGMFVEDDSSDIWFRLCDFFALFIAPMVIMSIMYSIIIKKLWAPNQAATMDSIARKRRVVVMCLAVTVCFFICWLPWHLSDIISDTIELVEEDNEEEHEEKEEDVSPNSADIQIFTTILPLANSFTSPILYAALNARFRDKMLAVLLLCTCRKRAKVAPVQGCSHGTATKSSLN